MATWQHLRSSTANKRPTTSLADGRIAINTNTASPGLFFKDSAGTGIVKVGPVHVGTTAPNSVPAAGGSSGNYLGEQWLDTSVSPAQMKVWNGSTWVGIVADELPVSKLQDGSPRQLIQTDAAGTGVEWTSNVDVPGTLDVTSTATFDSIAQYPAGSAGAPTITFTGDTNTGIYSPGADQVAISTNGTGRVFIESNGRVGVGVSNPAFPFQVNGSACVAGSSDNIFFGVDDNTSPRLGLVKQAGGGPFFAAGSATAFVFGHSSGTSISSPSTQTYTERMRLDSSGRLGLGTSSPVARLETISTATVNGVTNCTFRSSDNLTSSFYIGHGASGIANLVSDSPIGFGYNNGGTYVERMRIDSSGRVGVGTATPGRKLSIADSIAPTLGFYRGATEDGLISSESNSFGIQTFNNTPIKFSVVSGSSGFSERAQIDSSGRLLVGTSSAFDANYKQSIFIDSTGGTVYRNTTSGTHYPLGFQTNTGTYVGSVSTTSTATTYATSSDYRLKENVTAVTDGIARLQQLKPSRFNFIADPAKTVDGFIAHEVQAVVPEAITGEKDAVGADGNPIYQGIDQSKLVPLLTAALQEAVAKIESLAARLTAAGI